MSARFNAIFPRILKHEGGYVNHPRDPGGATNMGVTLATARAYGFDKDMDGDVDAQDVRLLTKNDANTVFKHGYWNKVNGDNLPVGLDYAVVDFAVHSGPSRAAKTLQAILGVKQDGVIGPLTIARARSVPVQSTIAAYNAARLSFLKRLPTYATFGKGWSSRLLGVERLALQDAAALGVVKEIKAEKPLGYWGRFWKWVVS